MAVRPVGASAISSMPPDKSSCLFRELQAEGHAD